MGEQLSGGNESSFLPQVMNQNWLALLQHKCPLRTTARFHGGVVLRVFTPAKADPEIQRALFRIQLQRVGKLNLQCFCHQMHGLIQQLVEVAIHHRKLPQRRHDRLLLGAIEQETFAVRAFAGPQFERFRHAVKGVGQLSQFTFGVSNSGSGRGITLSQAFGSAQ
jgi:hypothetical protein